MLLSSRSKDSNSTNNSILLNTYLLMFWIRIKYYHKLHAVKHIKTRRQTYRNTACEISKHGVQIKCNKNSIFTILISLRFDIDILCISVINHPK